jgi:hypothetical protein
VNAGGVVLIVAGVWVLTQILGGQMLERLAVLPGSS